MENEEELALVLIQHIEKNDLRAIELILKKHKVNPNYLTHQRVAPVHLVIGQENQGFAEKCLRLFLKHGADPNLRADEGMTPLHIAAAWGRLNVLRVLIKNGGDLNLIDDDEKTPLDYALENNHLSIVDYLRGDQIDKADDKILYGLDKVTVRTGDLIAEYQNPTPDFYLLDAKALPKDDYTRDWCEKYREFIYGQISDESEYFDATSFNSNNESTSKPNLFDGLETLEITSETSFDQLELASASVDFNGIERIDNAKTDHFADIDARDNSKRFFFDLETPECSNRVQFDDVEMITTVGSIGALEKNIFDVDDTNKTFDELETSDNTSKTESITGMFESISRISANNDYKWRLSGFETLQYDSKSLEASLMKSFDSHSNRAKSENQLIKTDNDDDGQESGLSDWLEQSETNVSQCRLSMDTDVESVEYKYVDAEKNIVMIERRLLVTPSAKSSQTNTTNSSQSLPHCLDYDTDTLRTDLTHFGYKPGPITKTTKRVYLRKLTRLKRHAENDRGNVKNGVDSPFKRPQTPKKVYCLEIARTLRHPTTFIDEIKKLAPLEQRIADEFARVDRAQKWRDGVAKCHFTYLLLDPRVTQNLPNRDLCACDAWQCFLNGIFYVGKGKRARPYAHLYEAVSVFKSRNGLAKSGKVKQIVEIWRANCGVVCLQVFQNVIAVEAFTREAAMISALGLNNLRNEKRGEFYGSTTGWSQKDRRSLGLYLLYRAMMVFMNEGERQLLPGDF